MKWIDWNKEKPKESGYYWFAFRECGDSYSCYTSQAYGYYDPNNLRYGIDEKECYEDAQHFKYIAGWQYPPEWPFNFNSPRDLSLMRRPQAWPLCECGKPSTSMTSNDIYTCFNCSRKKKEQKEMSSEMD